MGVLLFSLGLAVLAPMVLPNGGAEGSPGASPEVFFQCASSIEGKLRVTGLDRSTLSSCTGEVFARGSGLWGYRMAPSSSLSVDPESLAVVEVEAGGSLELTLEPARVDGVRLPAAFIAPVLREHDGLRVRGRILCERRAPTPLEDPKDGNHYSCAVPAGQLSVRVELPPFGASFIWNLVVGGAGKVPATLALPVGVALSGEVSDADATASLYPRGLEDLHGAVTFAKWATEPSRGGEVRFENVAPGPYVYRIDGRSGTSDQAMVVVPRGASEVRLPELSLPTVATLNFQVSPAADGDGLPWAIRLLPRPTNSHTKDTLSTETDPTGWQSISGVIAGDYLLLVEDSGGSIWLTEQVQVEDDRTLVLDLPRVAVAGRVHRGEGPFVGTLLFGGAHGTRRLTFATDEEGRFTGYLPDEGWWEVEIASEELGCAPCDGTKGSLRIPPVEVAVGPSGKALLDIEIPNTRLKGRVVMVETSPDGETTRRPQPGATVFITRVSGPPKERGRQAQIWSDDGDFDLVGLEPGEVYVGAMLADPPCESDWVEVEVQEDVEPASPLELVLQRKTHLLVELASANGAVGGATVVAIVPDGKSARGVSGVDGVASLELPPKKTGTLVVNAPGYGLVLEGFQVPAGSLGGQAVPVPLVEGSGSLALIDIPYDVFSEGSLISERGGILPLSMLASLAPDLVSFGESITIAGLAPGAYQLCTQRGDCWQGMVFAGGQSELRLSEAK